MAGSARSWVRISTITVCAGGSSSVLRKAWGVAAVIRSASSTMNTFTAASAGRREASRSSSRIFSILRASGPFGLSSGGVGAIRCTSGWTPRAARAAARPPAGATSAPAKASAVVLRPEPAGPTKA